MKRCNKPLVTGALLVAALFTQATAFAEPGASTNASHNRIVGIWDVEVSVVNCVTQAPLTSFITMHKFELGGTGQVVPATNPAALSAHLMVWEHIADNDYHWAVKMYRFTNGVAVGWTIIDSEVTISEDGTVYGGSGVASFYDLDGNFLMASCPSFAGTRFTGAS